MNSKDILVLSSVVGTGFLIWKSGFFQKLGETGEAVGDVLGGATDIIQGAGSAVSNVGQSAGGYLESTGGLFANMFDRWDRQNEWLIEKIDNIEDKIKNNVNKLRGNPTPPTIPTKIKDVYVSPTKIPGSSNFANIVNRAGAIGDAKLKIITTPTQSKSSGSSQIEKMREAGRKYLANNPNAF